jgi:hypothetical protein
MASLPGLISLYTPNLLLALFGTDPIQAENMIILDAAIAGLSGHPGGTTGQVQYNHAGVFGGIAEGAVGQVLTSNGIGVPPSFQASGSAPVLSVFGRTGAVVAQSGDYTYAQISGTPQLAVTFAPVTNEFVTGYSATTGLFTAAQPSYANISGTPQLPVTFAAVAHEWLNSYSSVTGLFTATQPAYTDISGTPQLAVTFAPVANEFLTGYTASTGVFTAAQPSAANLSNGTTGTGAVVLASAIAGFGSGTVTSVSFTGGLISVATPTTTPALTVAGTSGGIPYFSSGTTWATSAVLASTGILIGGGAGSPPTTNPALTFVGSYLTVGLTGTSSGTLALNGSTTGQATFTAPAVASPLTNAVVSSNYVQFPGITLAGAGSGIITILPQSAAGTYNFNLPITAGSAGQVLTSQAGGATAMVWTTPSTGTVTVVGAGSLTSTALVTGGGTTTLQTPSATSTLSAAGNMSLAGTLNVTSLAQSMIGALAFITGATAASSAPSIRATAANGGLVLNAANGNGLYLNFDTGTNIYFGNGASGQVGEIDSSGNLSLSGNITATAGWVSYTPTITSSLGAYTTVSGVGRYFKVGKMVTVSITITVTTVGTASGQTLATLPFTAGATSIFTMMGRETAVTGLVYTGTIQPNSTTVQIQSYLNAFGLTAGSILNIEGTYESST